VRKPARARPEVPAAAPPDTPLGAGAGAGLAGGRSTAEPPWPPPAGGSVGLARELAAAARPVLDADSRRAGPNQPAVQGVSSQLRSPTPRRTIVVAWASEGPRVAPELGGACPGPLALGARGSESIRALGASAAPSPAPRSGVIAASCGAVGGDSEGSGAASLPLSARTNSGAASVTGSTGGASGAASVTGAGTTSGAASGTGTGTGTTSGAASTGTTSGADSVTGAGTGSVTGAGATTSGASATGGGGAPVPSALAFPARMSVPSIAKATALTQARHLVAIRGEGFLAIPFMFPRCQVLVPGIIHAVLRRAPMDLSRGAGAGSASALPGEPAGFS
jgi:hypothetical protein